MVRRNIFIRTVLGAAAAVLALAAGSSASPEAPGPQRQGVHRTPAFTAIFGEVPPFQAPDPSYASVVYFPSAKEPGKFLPAPIFSFERGKEEKLSVRTVIRGIESDEFNKEIVRPFPRGADLLSLEYVGGRAVIVVGGTFRAGPLSRGERERAAGSLALTVAQFGKATEVVVTDAEGKARFGARSDGVPTADPGIPRVLGSFAIKEGEDRPATSLSLLFDRPVFVEEAVFYRPGGRIPYTGNAYSTGFGMTVEFRPEPKTVFNAGNAYRIRVTVRDGKGRRTSWDKSRKPKEVVRD
ncbi:MAG: GerMN domain-containing protein [Deltaproteobacteria bacterium]|nr:GerMN domain-containing protein [Deltaproteobacteria bacterium]